MDIIDQSKLNSIEDGESKLIMDFLNKSFQENEITLQFYDSLNNDWDENIKNYLFFIGNKTFILVIDSVNLFMNNLKYCGL